MSSLGVGPAVARQCLFDPMSQGMLDVAKDPCLHRLSYWEFQVFQWEVSP